MAGLAEPTLDSVLALVLANSGPVSPQDAVLVVLHSTLLSAKFVCVATGDEEFGSKTTDLPAVSTLSDPQLPQGWNSSQDVCSLQYRHEPSGLMCLVKTIPMGDHLLISAVVTHQQDKVITLTVTPLKYVMEKASYNSINDYTNLLELMSTLKEEMQMKLSAECAASGVHQGSPAAAPQSQSAPSITGNSEKSSHFPAAIDPLQPGPSGVPEPSRIHDPLRIGQPRRPIGDPDPLGVFDPCGYGDRDRLPFGGGGGGMIFDPRHNPGARGGFPGAGPLGPYPPGHPPGARFDPVSPLRPARPFRPGPNPPRTGFYGPNPDHLPPPGYDDMFS